MIAPLKYLIQHRTLGSYLADHPVWPTYVTKDKAKATRYTKEDADAMMRSLCHFPFADRFHLVEDDT